MFTRHRLGPTDKLDCPHAMGTDTFSRERAKSLRHFLLLPSPSVVYERGKPTNLRISFRASTSQFQTSGLRVRGHAGARPPAAQRAGQRYVGRCAEVVEAGSIAAVASKNGWPIQARFWLEWGTAFLAKEVLRFQHSKLPAVCREATLYSSKSGEGWVV